MKKDNNGESLLMYACKNGNEKFVHYILQKMSKDCLDEKDNDGNTALMFACQNGLNEIVQYLGAHEVEINTQNKNGEIPLIVDYLLDLGVDLDDTSTEGYTPLIWATRNGHMECVKLLLDGDCYVDFKDREGKNSINPCLRRRQTRHCKTFTI